MIGHHEPVTVRIRPVTHVRPSSGDGPLRHKRPVRYHAVASEVADQGGVGNDDLVGAELSGDEGYCYVG